MAMDVASLVSMVSQTSRGTQASGKTHGGFNLSDRRSGGFSAPWQDRTHQARMRSAARLDPRVSFVNEFGRRESGWSYQHPPLVRISTYQRILDMVQDANNRETPQVTAPVGSLERAAQQAERLENPIRERRKTVREALTGRR